MSHHEQEKPRRTPDASFVPLSLDSHVPEGSAPERFTSDKERLARSLVRLGFIRFGDFVVPGGRRSSYVLDLAHAQDDGPIISDFEREYSGMIARLPSHPDAVAAVPSANVPLVTRISRRLDLPVIPVGPGEAGGRPSSNSLVREGELGVVVVDDAATTGASILETARILKAEGFRVNNAMVLLDRQEGAREVLEREGIGLTAVFGARELFDYLKDVMHPEDERVAYRSRLITDEQYRAVDRYLKSVQVSKPT